jgi:hypothetical protein
VGLILKAVTRSVIHYVCSSLPLRKSVAGLSCVLISRPVCVSCHRTSADVCIRFLAWRVPLQGVANKLMTCGARSLVAGGKRKEQPACYRPSYCQLEYWTSQPRVLYRIAVTYREYVPHPTPAKKALESGAFSYLALESCSTFTCVIRIPKNMYTTITMAWET